MKKTIRLLSVFSLFLIASSVCSGQNKEASKSKNTAREANVDTATVFMPDDSVLVTFIELGSVDCIPCKMMQPIIDEIKIEFKGQVKVLFHDVWTEEGKSYAEKWKIRAIPTQIFLDKNGTEYFRHIGFFPKEELIKILKKKGVR